eukprot:8035738-Pyramimonas_sp.AAC.1
MPVAPFPRWMGKARWEGCPSLLRAASATSARETMGGTATGGGSTDRAAWASRTLRDLTCRQSRSAILQPILPTQTVKNLSTFA